MLKVKSQIETFRALSQTQQIELLERHLADLAYHYDYFRDLEVYVKTHKEELSWDFLNATYQIILNLAKAVEKA